MTIADLIDSGVLRRFGHPRHTGHQLVVADESALGSLLNELNTLREFATILAAEERHLKSD